MRIAYFDCFAGVAGDMTLGALMDLGVERAAMEAAVAGMGVTGFALESTLVRKHGIAGVKAEVKLTQAQPERHLADIERILDGGALAAPVRERARAVFRRLTEAEARVHRQPVERVHLHEVGALDAIVDVVGSCFGLEALGVERIVVSPVVTGRGMTRGEHGAIPVPGPATLELLTGFPTREGPVESEMTTPTGAALVTTLAGSFGPMPAMRVTRVGYGAGTKSFDALPNLLRIVLGETAGPEEAQEGSAVELCANLDDLPPQGLSWVQETLLAGGALDVWVTPIVMKKGRAGHLLSVLARPEDADRLARIVFAETTTIGLRVGEVRRWMLERRLEEVATPYGLIRVKVASGSGRVLNVQPEFDDCARAATGARVPLKEVQAAALAAWRERQPSS